MSYSSARARFSRIAIFAALTISTQGASATEFCNVKRTADGFVALREAPDPQSGLVGRMTHGDEVLGDPTVESRNGWIFVTWWKGGRFRPGGYEFDKPTGKGWVNSRLIEEECG